MGNNDCRKNFQLQVMQLLHLENGISAATRDDFQMTRALMNGMVFQEQQMKHSGLRIPWQKRKAIPSEAYHGRTQR
jgi:hypothetical protein